MDLVQKKKILSVGLQTAYYSLLLILPILAAAPSKAWACDLSLAGIAGSYPPGGMVISLLRVLCVVR
jgi:hypothetical protein